MPGYLVHVGATASCPHGGQVSISATQSKVKVGGQAVAIVPDTFSISGCAFTIPPSKPQPCTTIQWMMPATRVKVTGQPVILQDSTGLCLSADQIPGGPPQISQTQTKVKGT